MPLLNNGRLLFIHVPKNAGKSIEHAFGLSERSGSRSLLNKFAKLLLNKTSNDSARNQLHGSYDYTFSSQHFTFKEIVNLGLLDLNALNNITTLSVVRNPYDRAVSSVLHYHYNNIAENGIVIKNPNEFCGFYNLFSKQAGLRKSNKAKLMALQKENALI